MTRTTDTDAVEELSADLKAWQQVSGLSYREVAGMTGIALATVHQAFTGQPVSQAVATKLRAVLGRDGDEWRRIWSHMAPFREQYDRYRRAER
jgi:plasmid maintenance system antidote protein VapI